MCVFVSMRYQTYTYTSTYASMIQSPARANLRMPKSDTKGLLNIETVVPPHFIASIPIGNN